MRKVTLKKTITDRYNDFCIGHCIYVDGIIVYVGEEDDPKPVPLSGFEHEWCEHDTIAEFVKSLPVGKPVKRPKSKAMARLGSGLWAKKIKEEKEKAREEKRKARMEAKENKEST